MVKVCAQTPRTLHGCVLVRIRAPARRTVVVLRMLTAMVSKDVRTVRLGHHVTCPLHARSTISNQGLPLILQLQPQLDVSHLSASISLSDMFNLQTLQMASMALYLARYV